MDLNEMRGTIVGTIQADRPECCGRVRLRQEPPVEWREYEAVAEFCGTREAKRSDVP